MRTVAFAALLLVYGGTATAQELEPGAYWALPRGLNIVSVIAGTSRGDVTFDPALPVEEAHARIRTVTPVWTRSLAVAGRSANVGVQVPIASGHLEGLFRGAPAAADRFGLADPRVRFAINLYGAPTMDSREFTVYRLRTVVGASVTVVPPLGQYDADRYINLGSNRWSVKPEIGITRAHERWVFDVMAGVWAFSDNDEYVGGVRSQQPIVSTQFHVTYRFRPTLWLAANTNFYYGGRTAVDGVANTANFSNSRVGATLSAALNRRSAFRASISEGAFTRIGGDFVTVAVGYNYAW